MSLIATWSRVRAALTGKPVATACSACGRDVAAFLPLPDFYFDHLRNAGWPYPFERSETINVAQYSCPHCAASDRDRLYALYLDELFRKRSKAEPVRVVDFAPSAALAAWIKRTTQDWSPPLDYRSADLLADGVDDKVDLTDMAAYAANRFDLFLCSHVLEHVIDDRKALREIYRVLKPGGRAVLLVPIVLGIEAIDEDPTLTDPQERWRRFGQDDHVRLYSKAGFVGRIREAGFLVHQLGVAHFGRRQFATHGITAQSVLYVAEKPKAG